MGRMRRIPARIRFAPRTGLRKSAVAPRRCRCGDGISTTALRRFSLCATSFDNRSSAVVAHATVSRGRRTNPVLTYETALRRFPLCATSLYNRTSAVFVMLRAVGAYQWGMVLSMGDVDGWQEVFMQNYSCGDCFEVMAFRYFFYDLSFN